MVRATNQEVSNNVNLECKTIYVTSCESHGNSWKLMEEYVRDLAKAAKAPRYKLSEDPDTADFILITNIRDENSFESLRRHPLVKEYPEKVFTQFLSCDPIPLLPGIYPNYLKNAPTFGRIALGTYGYFKKRYKQHIPADTYRNRTGEYLFSFMGSDTHPIRMGIAREFGTREDCLIKVDSLASSIYRAQEKLPEDYFERYIEVTRRSKFALCPAGSGPASARIFEVMEMGTCPVILADTYRYPPGPEWAKCSITIRQDDYKHLAEILEERESEWHQLGMNAHKAWEQYFAPDVYFNYIGDALAKITRERFIPEALIQKFFWAMILNHRIALRLRKMHREFKYRGIRGAG